MTTTEVQGLEDAPKPIKIKAVPHMPEVQLGLLTERLSNCECFLEYGAGGSSRLAVQSGVKSIYSVESDADFAEAVKKQVGRDIRHLDPPRPCQFRIFVPKLGPTVRWGFPASNSMAEQWPTYPLKIWDYIEKDSNSPDLILVDGRFRLACFLVALLKARVGTTILFDDYAERDKRYLIAEMFVRPVQIVGQMAEFTVPRDLDLRSIGIELLKASMRPG